MATPTIPAIRSKRQSSLKETLLSTIAKAGRDDVGRLASSVSFFAILSLSPFLLLLVGTIDLFVGHGAGAHRLLVEIGSVAGPDVREYVARIVHSDQSRSTGFWAGALSLVVTFFGASNLFLQVDSAVSAIWRLEPGSTFLGNLILTRIIAFASVLVFGILLLGWVALDSSLAWTAHHVGRFPGWTAVSFLVTAPFLALGCSLTYTFLPRGRLSFRQALPGGLLAGFGLAACKLVLATYFAHVTGFNGAAGGVIVLLLWMYYSILIYLVGIEVNCVLHSSDQVDPAAAI